MVHINTDGITPIAIKKLHESHIYFTPLYTILDIIAYNALYSVHFLVLFLFH